MNQWTTTDSIANSNSNGHPNPYPDPSHFLAQSADNQNMFAPQHLNQSHQHQQQQQQQHQQQLPSLPQALNAQNRSYPSQQYPYPVSSVIPSKRPRPADDLSPAQPPNPMNTSRSQTPQQPGPFPSPFPHQQHLQRSTSANATPSPTISNQQYRPGQTQGQTQAHLPRMQTASPHPAQPGISISPPPAEPNGRMTPQTPHFPGTMNLPGQIAGQSHPQMNSQMSASGFVPGANVGQGYPSNFQGMPMPNQQQGQFGNAQLPPNLAAQQAEVQRQYQMKLQQQQYQTAMQNRQRMGGINSITGQPSTPGTPTRPQSGSIPPNPQQQQQMMQAQAQIQNFVKTVQAYMRSIGQPFDPSPLVSGRPINPYSLFTIVSRGGGFQKVMASNSWNKVAAALHINETQYPSASSEIQGYYERNLAPYEAAYLQHARQAQKKPDGHAGGSSNGQMSPTQEPQTPQMSHQSMTTPMMQSRPGPTPQMTPQMTPVQAHSSIPPQNGFPTPQTERPSSKGQLTKQKSSGRSHRGSPALGQLDSISADDISTAKHVQEANLENEHQDTPERADLECYQPSKVHFYHHYGGIEVDAFFGPNHLTEEILKFRPNVPDPVEMGLIDVRAIANSLQSGIKSEVRYALDVLQKITFFFPLDLACCDDLLEILVDCGEEQLEILSEHASEDSDEIDLPSYENVMRYTRSELEWSLQDQHEVGSLEYDLDRTAERLLAITRILRNLSLIQVNSNDRNSPMLGQEMIVKFLSNAIRLLGTRNMFLRSHWKIHELMTDIIHLLSNVGDEIVLPSEDEALSILHFLLAFAPDPDPTSASELVFTSYDPKRHKYYYHAIDSLAKLLIKDPNRSVFRNIFAEASSNRHDSVASSKDLAIHQRYDVITRAFGLAIAVIPDYSSLTLPDERLVLLREAILSQGILAADVITGLLPSSAAADLARAWLSSRDNWVACMINLCVSIFSDMNLRAHEGWCSLLNRVFNMLGHLATLSLGKIKPRKVADHLAQPLFGALGSPLVNGDAGADAGDGAELAHSIENQKAALKSPLLLKHDDGIIPEMLPNWTFVLGALNMAKMDTNVLRSLVVLASLDE